MKNLALLIICMYSICLMSQDSLNMQRIGNWNPANMPIKSGVKFNDVWGYTASNGGEYAIIGNVDSILVVDVTNPNNPERVYGFNGGNRTIWRDFKTFGDYMYAVCDNCSEGLHIFDMSGLPSGNINHVASTTDFFTKAHNIFVDSTSQKLYVTGSDGAYEGLVILDISVPGVPTHILDLEFDDLIGQPSANFYVHDVYVKNDTAYCSHGNKGFYVWDLTDLADVTLLGDYNSPGYNHSSWINDSGGYAYYAEEIPLGQPMAVIDLSNLGDAVNNITLVTTFKDPISNSDNDVTPHNPFVNNDTLYISYYEDGMKVYDLSNPQSPDLIAYYDTYPNNGGGYTGYNGAWGSYPFFSSGNLLISDITYGLNILRVQDCVSPTLYYKDGDGDGFGDVSFAKYSCSIPGGYVIDNTDCNDDDANSYPGAPEICDGIDNDCDGLVDADDGDVVFLTFYFDGDQDGYGDPNNTINACAAPEGYLSDNTDCDDANNMVNPAFPEVCDGIDNNCNNLIDNDDPELASIEWYLDNDNDGSGDQTIVIYQCEPPNGYVAFPGDCDDDDAENFPNNIEICDGQDNNCDAIIDEGCGPTPCDDINLNINLITQDTYQAKAAIVSDATVTTSQDISFYAGNEVSLNAMFEVENGAEFLASIADCEIITNRVVSVERDDIKSLLMSLKADQIPNRLKINVKDQFGDKYRFTEKQDFIDWIKMHYFNSFQFNFKK